MKKADRDQHLRKLQLMRTRLSEELLNLTDEAFEKSSGGSTQPSHMAELGSDTYEQDVTLQMLQCEEGVLEEINEAIERVAEGTFGKCERCQKRIPKPRLNAIPYTRYCVACAKDIELED